MYCSKCGKKSTDSATFCSTCGNRLSAQASMGQDPVSNLLHSESQPEETSMNETPNATSDQAAPTRSPPATSVEPRYKGVGGWLLFFCLGLTVLSPLITLGSLVASYSESSQYFDTFPGLLVITVIDTFLSVGLMAFSIYAGVGLWRIRPGALQTAKKYLLWFLAYLAIAAVLPFMAGLPSAANDVLIGEVAKSTFRGVIYFAIWYSYLNKSQRVRGTYES